MIELHERCSDCPHIGDICPGQFSRLACIGAVPSIVDVKPKLINFDISESRHAIYERFGRKRRIVIKDGSIVCASDSRQWAALQLMLASLLLSHDIPVTVIDLGLTDEQFQWLTDNGVAVTEKPSLIMPNTRHMWQTWNKPLYFDSAHENKVLWIDSDCVIDASLKPMFNAIDDGPLIMRDSFTDDPTCVPNNPALYDMFPIDEHRRIRSLNAGVIGLKLDRDRRLLSEWSAMVYGAAENTHVNSDWFSWWDQGALIFACERLGIKITDRREWNNSQSEIRRFGTKYDNPRDMLADLPKGSTIFHYLGDKKPYGWESLPLSLKPAPDLSVFILSHEDVKQPEREFVDVFNLSWFDPKNDWSESRAYEQIPESCLGTDYIGLASISWVKKYERFGVWAPWEFGELELKPDRVWCAMDTQDTSYHPSADWVDHMEAASPGIRHTIDELRRVSGMVEIKSSAWSNNFVMHRSIYAELADFHRRMKSYFLKTYPGGPPYKPADPVRGWGYLAEAFTVHWLACRDDIDIRSIRRPGFHARPRGDAPRRSVAVSTGVKCDHRGCSHGCQYSLCRKYWKEVTISQCVDCIAIGGNS